MKPNVDSLTWQPAEAPKPDDSFVLAELLHSYVIVAPCDPLPEHAVRWARIRPPIGEGGLESCLD